VHSPAISSSHPHPSTISSVPNPSSAQQLCESISASIGVMSGLFKHLDKRLAAVERRLGIGDTP
jgi:hypothetical protein